MDWQAYFHERNRLIAALLHSPFPKGGRILRESVQYRREALGIDAVLP